MRIGSEWNLTRTCNVSTLGKHLRKAGSILASFRTPNRTFRAKTLTLGIMEDGIIFVPLYHTIENAMTWIKFQANNQIDVTDG